MQQLADGGEVEVGAELGRGSGAVVREGAWRGKPVAVKVRHDPNPHLSPFTLTLTLTLTPTLTPTLTLTPTPTRCGTTHAPPTA